MRILFLSAANSIHTVKWVNALADRGHDIFLVYNTGHDPEKDKIKESVFLHALKYKGMKGYYLNSHELRKLVEKIKPDVINVHYASGYGTLARRSKITPVLLSVWGSDVYDFPYKSRVKRDILKKNINYASKLASTSFCMAEQLRRVMQNSRLKISITPFGVDTDVFNASNFKQKDDESIILGNVKALKSIYAIDDFIKAVSILLKNLKDIDNQYLVEKIKVYIYGDGEQKQELQELIYSLGLENVIFLKGKISNNQVPETLSNMDIFCVTSRSESFGVAVVEAMSMEIPVVATDVDGFKEVVVDNETGIIVPRGNVESIAYALQSLICDKELRKKFGKNGRQRVEELFDFQKNVDVMEELYKELMANGK